VVSTFCAEVTLKESSPAVRAAAGLFGGFVLLAWVNAVAIAVAVPLPAAGISLRLAHHLFDAAETLGVGALVAGVVGVFIRYVRLPRWGMVGLAIAANVALMGWVLGGYLSFQAPHMLNGRFATALLVGFLVLPGIGLAFVPVVGALCARHRRLRFLPLAVATGTMVGSQSFLRDDYLGTHGMLVWGAVLLSAPTLAPFVERAARALAMGRPGRVALAAVALFGLAGITVPPPNATRFELFRQPCAVAPWVLATLLWRAPRLHAEVTLPSSPWLRDRSGAPGVSPTVPQLLPSDAVVVLITVDALREDVVDDPANDARFPTLARLKREGVVFTHASAPGTQTVISLSTLFSGAYPSEQRWKRYGLGRSRFFFPVDDPFPRFPALLSDHGVATANYEGLAFLRGDYGITRGFREQTVLLNGIPASKLIKPLLDRLAHPGQGPLFLYTHLLDPHEPYGGPTGKNDCAHYLSAVVTVDKQLGRVVSALEQQYGDRWALFVSADHGEAFGEHETREHGKTLYEELLHVPLIARSPRFPPRVIGERVGLVDLGPTLLDLFGADTPGTWNGQTLVPFLAGGKAELTRPLMAEGRLRRELTEPDGLKVIDDPLREVVEVYDLAKDPRETRNLFDVDPARADPALAELRAFFAVHAWRERGYEPPYLP
jgi:hypothetical protein